MHPDARIWFLTTKAHQTISDVMYRDGDFLMFGRESAGLPEELLAAHPAQCVRIPMVPDERSLNLASSCAIALYEAQRQLGFADLEKTGDLHRLSYADPTAQIS
jgi:tRNA (cytidine/uridine-2'-O-)-methyltransferase